MLKLFLNGKESFHGDVRQRGHVRCTVDGLVSCRWPMLILHNKSDFLLRPLGFFETASMYLRLILSRRIDSIPPSLDIF